MNSPTPKPMPMKESKATERTFHGLRSRIQAEQSSRYGRHRNAAVAAIVYPKATSTVAYDHYRGDAPFEPRFALMIFGNVRMAVHLRGLSSWLLYNNSNHNRTWRSATNTESEPTFVRFDQYPHMRGGVSVEEVTGAGQIHGHAGLLGRFDDLLVADGTARLHDGLNACVDEHLRTIREREERIGCSDRTVGARHHRPACWRARRPNGRSPRG